MRIGHPLQNRLFGAVEGRGLAAQLGQVFGGIGTDFQITGSFTPQETADLVRAEGAEAVVVQANVADDAACRAIAKAAEPFGRVDCLFNNAGITKFAMDHSDLDALNAEDFLGVYSVNVIGAFQMIRAARPLLEAGEVAGAVVNTSSIAGVKGNGSSVAYAASKGAMNTMTLSLARALAPKIRVNAICPGYIDTGWFARTMDAQAHERLAQTVAATTPLKVASKAEDIAAAAVFLGSPASRHMTGELMIVDGGSHLGYPPRAAR